MYQRTLTSDGYERTLTAKFLTGLLHSPVYRRAHGIDRVTSDIHQYLSTQDKGGNVPMVLLHYVESAKGKTRLAVSVLLRSDPEGSVSSIQGDLTRGANLAAAMCAKLGLVMFATVPISYTTNMSGLHITSVGVLDLGRA